MEVSDQAVIGVIHIHRRDDHAIGQLELAQADRHEHRWDRITPVVEPPIDPLDELWIARLEIRVRHAPASRQQVECELQRFLMGVLRDVLEPLETCLRGPLGALDHGPPLHLVGGERFIEARVFVEAGSQRERILHGELGP